MRWLQLTQAESRPGVFFSLPAATLHLSLSENLVELHMAGKHNDELL